MCHIFTLSSKHTLLSLRAQLLVMACRAKSKSKGSITLQLPPHVQNTMNKEDRLLQQTLDDLKIETKHLFKCISQDQQVAATKLRILEKRLEMSKARSLSAMSVGTNQPAKPSLTKRLSQKDACSTDYFKSLLTPGVRDHSFSLLMDVEPTTTHTRKAGEHHPAVTKKKSSLKKSGSDSQAKGNHLAVAQSDRETQLRKSVSFSIKSSKFK